jgi:hypothetical protein
MSHLRLSRTAVTMAILVLAVIIMLLVSSVRIAGAAGAQDQPAKNAGEPPAKADLVFDVKAPLLDNDPLDPKRNEPCKIYKVKLRKGKSYSIDMMSTEFDSYLRLENSDGKQLAEDDDGGDALDARILFTPDVDGEFKIIATRFGGGTGNFRLTVRDIQQLRGKPLALVNGMAMIESRLTQDDPVDAAGRKHRCQVHTIKMVAGRTYTIDMMSNEFDTFLRLIDSQSKKLAEDDDGGEGTNSRIVFTAQTSGDYRIIATTFDGQLGSYTLTVREQN